jgi:D-glycero-D-manno-heptose 1,7-bisphosphate phosphatase
MTPGRAVFLDRDGVMNEAVVVAGKPYPPARLAEVRLPAGVAEALGRLKEAGYLLIGVTNQPDVARGSQTRAAVEAINSFLCAQLPVAEILVCYHDDRDQCACRKPRPGLLLQAAERHHLQLGSSWMVGDRWKDVAAGKAAGVHTIFLDLHYQEAYLGPSPEFQVGSVREIPEIVLNEAAG